jgi:hypothetical protein
VWAASLSRFVPEAVLRNRNCNLITDLGGTESINNYGSGTIIKWNHKSSHRHSIKWCPVDRQRSVPVYSRERRVSAASLSRFVPVLRNRNRRNLTFCRSGTGTVINYGSGTVIKWNHKSSHGHSIKLCPWTGSAPSASTVGSGCVSAASLSRFVPEAVLRNRNRSLITDLGGTGIINNYGSGSHRHSIKLCRWTGSSQSASIVGSGHV